jgi:hypothetical protein
MFHDCDIIDLCASLIPLWILTLSDFTLTISLSHSLTLLLLFIQPIVWAYNQAQKVRAHPRWTCEFNFLTLFDYFIMYVSERLLCTIDRGSEREKIIEIVQKLFNFPIAKEISLSSATEKKFQSISIIAFVRNWKKFSRWRCGCCCEIEPIW